MPSASVCASVEEARAGAAAVLKKGRRLIPCTPSVTQNCNGLVCAELDGAERIGDAEEVARENVWRRLVETPVRQRDARIDSLKLAFEIEQVGTMPGQKARRAVRLRRADVGVHVAEVREAPEPWLLSCANADTKRSRSPAVSVLAFLRTRTIT